VLACGLSKLYMDTDINVLGDQAAFDTDLHEVSLRVANCLYWLKLKEDQQIYFADSVPENNQLRKFLVSIYSKVTPSVVKDGSLVELPRRRNQTVPSLYSDIWYSLLSVDEYIVFKKHFVAAFSNDKARIETFFERHGPMRQMAEVVFRCKRVVFPRPETNETDPKGSK